MENIVIEIRNMRDERICRINPDKDWLKKL